MIQPLRAVITIILLLCAPRVHAGIVGIVLPNRQTAEVNETVSRVHGELISVGLEVRMLAPPGERNADGSDPRAFIEKAADEGNFDAIIDVIGDSTPIWVDVWVIEKSPRRVELWRVASEPDATNASERLAIRAIEVLRSSLLESAMTDKPQPTKPATAPASNPPSTTRSREPTKRVERVGIELGATLLASTGGVGQALLPVLRLSGLVSPSLGIHAEFAALGTQPTVSGAAGSAHVSEQYYIIGGSYRLSSNPSLYPYFALSAGAFRTLARGEASSPLVEHNAASWAFLVDTSVGAQLRLPGRLTLTLAGRVQFTEPYVTIHVTREAVATAGRPNLGVTLTMGTWL